MSDNEQPRYKTWPNLIPIPSDALIFRRRWAEVKGNDHLWQMRRQLARDYAVAKCSGRDEQEINQENNFDWLDEAVLRYIKNNPRSDSVDICAHFKLRADITMGAVARLQEAGKIERVQPRVEPWYVYRWGLSEEAQG